MINSKVIFFDSGPIISLVMSRLIWILPELKKKYGGKFYITPAVKRELVERPLLVKRFSFEALQVSKLIDESILEVYDKVPQRKSFELTSLANSSFKIKNKSMDVVQSGEMESVASAFELGASIVMDERTLRLFIENPTEMKKLLGFRFKKNVAADEQKMKMFSESLKSIKIIRSIELVGVAFKLGLLNSYIPKIKNGKTVLLDSVLWAVKYNGCAVTEQEIEEIKKYLLR